MIAMREPTFGIDYHYDPDLDAYVCKYCGYEVAPPDEEWIKMHIKNKHPRELLV